jgi:hypothetical protein
MLGSSDSQHQAMRTSEGQREDVSGYFFCISFITQKNVTVTVTCRLDVSHNERKESKNCLLTLARHCAVASSP